MEPTNITVTPILPEPSETPIDEDLMQELSNMATDLIMAEIIHFEDKQGTVHKDINHPEVTEILQKLANQLAFTKTLNPITADLKLFEGSKGLVKSDAVVNITST